MTVTYSICEAFTTNVEGEAFIPRMYGTCEAFNTNVGSKAFTTVQVTTARVHHLAALAQPGEVQNPYLFLSGSSGLIERLNFLML